MYWSLAMAAIILLASLGGTGLVLTWLRQRRILDHPNERSSHSLPTPRGGGIAVTGVLAVTLALAGTPCSLTMAALTIGLGVISWIDDVRDISPLWRLLAQVAAVSFAIVLWPERALFFQGLLPPAFDALAAGILWVGFINAFNFMDGIDGISGIEATAIGAGVVLVAGAAGLGGPTGFFGLMVAAAALGFLWWNWHPARVFLGDVGSVPLGFLTGWLLLRLAAEGLWAAALILPAYYLMDAGITLGRRLLRREKIWQAHREHFYQIAVRSGRSHSWVALRVLATDIVLVGLAVIAARELELIGLLGAVATVAVLLFLLAARAKGGIKPSR